MPPTHTPASTPRIKLSVQQLSLLTIAVEHGRANCDKKYQPAIKLIEYGYVTSHEGRFGSHWVTPTDAGRAVLDPPPPPRIPATPEQIAAAEAELAADVTIYWFVDESGNVRSTEGVDHEITFDGCYSFVELLGPEIEGEREVLHEFVAYPSRNAAELAAGITKHGN